MNEEKPVNDMWAVIELMGHGRTAGLIRTSDLGGLLRVDVPDGDGYRTEYYGAAAIYGIKVVSEEIARAYARPEREIYSYDEPIVPRAMYEQALSQSNRQNDAYRRQIDELQRRLTAVNALPAGESNGGIKGSNLDYIGASVDEDEPGW